MTAKESQSITVEFLASAKCPLIVVLGPTASGKTGFSIDLALRMKDASDIVEVVNADSRQLYRHLDIGTAKITGEEMRGVPHHLLSALDPKQDVNVAWYQREATKAIDDIRSRGNVPMLVGGSMLYISSIIDGLQPLPAADPIIRADLEQAYDRDGGVALYRELSDVDPASAEVIPRENRPYVIRALEIHRLTGRPKSQQLTKADCLYDLLVFGIDRPRAELTKRIDARTHHLLRSGWIEEVRGLLDRGYSIGDPGMRSHGYPEIVRAITDGADPLLAEPIVASKTRHYAKRQRTWWKGDKRILWITP